MRKFGLLIVVSAIVGRTIPATTTTRRYRSTMSTNDTVYCADVIGKIAFGTAMTFGGTTPTTATITIDQPTTSARPPGSTTGQQPERRVRSRVCL